MNVPHHPRLFRDHKAPLAAFVAVATMSLAMMVFLASQTGSTAWVPPTVTSPLTTGLVQRVVGATAPVLRSQVVAPAERTAAAASPAAPHAPHGTSPDAVGPATWPEPGVSSGRGAEVTGGFGAVPSAAGRAPAARSSAVVHRSVPGATAGRRSTTAAPTSSRSARTSGPGAVVRVVSTPVRDSVPVALAAPRTHPQAQPKQGRPERARPEHPAQGSPHAHLPQPARTHTPHANGAHPVPHPASAGQAGPGRALGVVRGHAKSVGRGHGQGHGSGAGHGYAPASNAGPGHAPASNAGHGHGHAPASNAGHGHGHAPASNPGHGQGHGPHGH